MDRAERVGLGIAATGHVALLAALSLGIFSTAKLPPMKSDPLDVMLVDEVGRVSAAPDPATEPPAEAMAPELGPVAEPAPAEPSPAEPEHRARSSDVPVVPKPAVNKPEPQREARKDIPDLGDRRRPDREKTEARQRTADRAAGSRLGPDFLKGISDTPKGKGAKPRAQAMSAAAQAGLYAAIYRAFKPCYDLGPLKGTSAASISTVLRIRYRPDGSIAGQPEVVEQAGIGDGNRRYAAQVADVAKRSVLRCSPVRLPAELYEQGWNDFELNFIPEELG